jgi:AraC-like DNA-binding protein
MKSLHPFLSKTDPLLHWRNRQLPIGLRIACIKGTFDAALDIALPDIEGPGIVLTFIHYKGDLQILPGGRLSGQEAHRGEPVRRGEPAHPGMGLLSVAGQSIRFQSSSPIQFSAVTLFIPADWIGLFLKENAHFSKIGQVLEEDQNIITCRVGRRQLSLFSEMLALDAEVPAGSETPGGVAGSETPGAEAPAGAAGLLEMQNHALSLLEYFLCNRHRSVLGANAAAGIDNEDDLSLIREVESYISEYYCSDTFTVDSILKKTYTSYHRLNFLFKSIHGMTISEYIRNKRIEKSKEMIAANAKSISQIAYEIGYSSISNYILAFKKIYQITPGKYKKQMEA